MSFSSFYKDKFVFYLTLGLFVLRLCVLGYVIWGNPLGTALFTFPDSLNYLHPARTLLEQGALLEAYTQQPLTFRTPGYPFFLAVIFKLAGESAWAVGLVQIFLATAILIPVYLSAREFLPKSAARLAVLLCAASSIYFVYSFAYLADILFAFLMTCFIYSAICFIKRPCTRLVISGACFLAAAIFVRPVAYNWFFISCILLGIFLHQQPRRWFLKYTALFALITLFFTGMWHLRNWTQTGYAAFHTSTAYNLYYWNLDSVAREKNISFQEASALLSAELPAGFEQQPPAQREAWMHTQARKMILKYWPDKLFHTPFWLGKTLLGSSYTQLSRILLGTPSLDDKEFSYQLNKTSPLPAKHLKTVAQWLLFLLSALQTCLTAAGALWGSWWLWKTKKDRPVCVVLWTYILYFWGISSVFFGAGGRYRAPFESVLCLLAAAGIHALWQQYFSRSAAQKNFLLGPKTKTVSNTK